MNNFELGLLALLATLVILIFVRIIQDRSQRAESKMESSDPTPVDRPAPTPPQDFPTRQHMPFGDYRDWVDESSWSKNRTANPTADHRTGKPESAPVQEGRRRQPPARNRASARIRRTSKPDSGLDYNQLARESPLARLGYRVGKTKGLPVAKRRELLQAAFEDFLPNVKSSEYVANWGGPGTTLRHDRICNHLRWQIERSEGNPKMRQAASDWKSDLKWFQSAFRKHR